MPNPEINIDSIIKRIESRQAVYEQRVNNGQLYHGAQLFKVGFSAKDKLSATEQILSVAKNLLDDINNGRYVANLETHFSLSKFGSNVGAAANEKGFHSCFFHTRKLGDDFEDLKNALIAANNKVKKEEQQPPSVKTESGIYYYSIYEEAAEQPFKNS